MTAKDRAAQRGGTESGIGMSLSLSAIKCNLFKKKMLEANNKNRLKINENRLRSIRF